MKPYKTIVHRVAVLPSIDICSICTNCVYRHLVECNNDIYDTSNELRQDTPIIECYETGHKRIVLKCAQFTPINREIIKVNRVPFDYDSKSKTFNKRK